ncbi:DUF998 domain-containing protein [Amycolatopsis sp. cg5]|uniref:DUF998 domain-containing protein n=1 Tax=Amycolatopsis sp. cg5 TaxID=3238802 RepID=UPI003523E9E5
MTTYALDKTSSPARARLLAGVVAGPLYLALGVAQAATRDGFDLTVHPFSFLSLGAGGWVQIANFVVTGVLFIISAVGLRTAMRGSTWGPLLIGGMGVGMVAGGVFTADPAFGFPAGAPAGQPESVSWHGTLHMVAFLVAIVAWTLSCFVFARFFAARKQKGLAVYSVLTGVALLATPAFMSAPGGVVVLYVAATLGWVWSSVAIGSLVKEHDNSDM